MKLLNMIALFALGLFAPLTQADPGDAAYYLNGNAYKINRLVGSYVEGDTAYVILEVKNLANGSISFESVPVDSGNNDTRALKKLKKKVQRKPAGN